MESIIGIDIGTTHIKSVAFGMNGNIISQQKAETPIDVDEYGNVYKPLVIWEIVKEQIQQLLNIDKIKVKGISVTGMSEAGLIINKYTGEEETDIIPWFDKRTISYSNKITNKEDMENFKTTGLRNSFKYGIYKFLWLLDNKNINKHTAIWLSICDYIVWKLTNKFVTDPTFAVRTYVYNMKLKDWDENRLTTYGLTKDNFPNIKPSGEAIGKLISHSVMGEIPIVGIGGHDHVCAAFGLLYNKRDTICNSAGTSETYIGLLEDTNIEFNLDSGLTYGPFVDCGYFWMANIPSSGHSIEWFRKNVQYKEISYEEMNKNLESLTKEPTEILYFPYLTGIGTPYYNPEFSASLLGLKKEHTEFHIMKGIIEGIQYQAVWIMDILKNLHKNNPKNIMCAGGSTNSKVWMQTKADVLGLNVNVPFVTEATVLGAVALFIRKNFENYSILEFLKQPLKSLVYTPDENNYKKYSHIQKTKYMPFINMMMQINK